MTKTGVKEFLRPTKVKALITFLIVILPFIIGFVLFFLNGGIEGRCWGEWKYLKNDPFCVITNYIAYFMSIIFFPLIMFNADSVYLSMLRYPIFILYSYFLSCLIIFIYNKIRNKGKFKNKK